MSQIVLSFLHSTLLLSFYIDAVLTLSIPHLTPASQLCWVVYNDFVNLIGVIVAGKEI